MNGDKHIRRATAAVVVAVATFAAVVSYSHIYDLGSKSGQFGTAGILLPLSVDGLILAASLVMLHEARAGRKALRLGRAMLVLGVAATVAANVGYGLAYGPVGAIVSAWPAVAFIGSAEMLIQIVHRSNKTAPQASQPKPATMPTARPETKPKPRTARTRVRATPASLEAATQAYNATPMSSRALAKEFGISRRQSDNIVKAASNGHA